MRIKVVFDKDVLHKNLYTGWGLSFLIGDKVLFDTGENGQWLIDNMKKLKIDIDKLRAVVISHDHWDHTGGLWELLIKKPNMDIYGCPGFGDPLKDKIKAHHGTFVENDGFFEIEDNIYVTGEILGTYKGVYMPEQALVVKTDKGITVMTGCSHPGIAQILETVRNKFSKENIYLVFGGFHLKNNDKKSIKAIIARFKEMGVEKAAPTHCSGKDAEMLFKKEYKTNFIPINVGQTLEV